MIALLLALLAPPPSAAEDAFRPVPKALAQTSHAQDCGFEKSLRAGMPPIDQQAESPWCASHATKLLIDYFEHRHVKGDHYQNRVSVTDLNSLDADLPANQRARFPELTHGADAFSILEGAQAEGKIYLDRDYPFDQSLFDDNGTLDQLTGYYLEDKPYADLSALRCRPTSVRDITLEDQFPGIGSLLAPSGDVTAFVNGLQLRHRVVAGPRAGAERQAFAAPFNVRNAQFSTGDEVVEELRQSLESDHPVGVNICQYQLARLPRMSYLTPPAEQKTECGHHEVVVIGMKNIQGKCQVELRNSWGEDWPRPGAGGYAFVPLQSFLRILDLTAAGQANLVSLRDRAPGAPVENEMQAGKNVYVGETHRGEYQGQGTLLEESGNLFEGSFAKNDFLRGHYEGTLAGGAHYEGELAHGQPNGEGLLKRPDGTVMKGQFRDGELVDGDYYEPREDDPRSFNKITFKDGEPTN